MPRSFAGCRVALAEGRQLEELAGLLEKEGAVPVRCPLLDILDAPDPEPVVAWIDDLIAGKFGLVVLLTGEGVRRLLGFAARAGKRDAFTEALAGPRLVCRGPKPVRELKGLGVTPHATASPATTEGVIQALKGESLKGASVGVQLYAPDNPALLAFLADAGATVSTVLPYVYAPASDAERVADLIDRMAAGGVDAIVFTSSPQVERLVDVANETGRAAALAEGFRRVTVASVGPVVANTLARHQVRMDVCPPQGFVMKNLVQQLKRHVEAQPAP